MSFVVVAVCQLPRSAEKRSWRLIVRLDPFSREYYESIIHVVDMVIYSSPFARPKNVYCYKNTNAYTCISFHQRNHNENFLDLNAVS